MGRSPPELFQFHWGVRGVCPPVISTTFGYFFFSPHHLRIHFHIFYHDISDPWCNGIPINQTLKAAPRSAVIVSDEEKIAFAQASALNTKAAPRRAPSNSN